MAKRLRAFYTGASGSLASLAIFAHRMRLSSASTMAAGFYSSLHSWSLALYPGNSAVFVTR
jgi:hypothetical protein